MRPARHRYDPRLRPVRHRQARTPLWIPLWVPALLIFAGASGVVLAVFPTSGVPGRLVLPPAVHATPGAQPSVSEGVVAVDTGQGQDQQQRGDDPASRSTPRDVPGQPPTAPAASSPAQVTPTPLSLPAPSSPPPMVVPSPTPSPTCPGQGRKPPRPTRSPRVQVGPSADMRS
jgi:hypothetical protein